MTTFASRVPGTSAVPLTDSSRLAAYCELGKPRIAVMVLLSMAMGFLLGSQGEFHGGMLLQAGVGVFLAVLASSAWNQYLERNTDALMPRTRSRPLPSGRLHPAEVLLFGVAATAASFVQLWLFVNPLTAWLSLATIGLYAACYTPLKRHSSLCTVIGAVPGAMPPALGWTAAGGQLDAGAFSLFALLFVWQFPHFLAIAWMYQDQYAAAGLRMTPGQGRPGIVGAIAAGYALVLIPVSLLPIAVGLGGNLYGAAAVAAGVWYAAAALRFQREETRLRARKLLWASLAYLPAVMLALTVDHLRLLS